MRDRAFEMFIDEFGEATHRVEAPQTAIDKWRGKLPDRLLTYWEVEGWCGYADGLFWIVDPDDYEDLVEEWLEGSKLQQVDVFHVIARTAFGKLYLCGESTGQSLTLNCTTHAIFALERDLKRQDKQDIDISIRAFLGLSKDNCDLYDESDHPLFARAFETLGNLEPDEMYGFEPALVVGGKMLLENLRKVKLDQHLTILRQLAAPIMPFANIDIDALIDKK